MEHGHEDAHWNHQRQFHWRAPVVYWGEFERGHAKEDRLRRNKRLCRKCQKSICECEIVTPAQDWKGQIDMYRKDILFEAVLLAEDIDSWMEQWYGEPYHGIF